MRNVDPSKAGSNGWLIRLALLCFPAEARAEYGAHIAADIAREDAGRLFANCLDIIWKGLGLHVESIARNVTFALRAFLKAPLLPVVAILAIALPMGANVAVASILDGVIFRPLPYPHVDRLVLVDQIHASDLFGVYPSTARYIAAKSQTIEQLSLAHADSKVLVGNGPGIKLSGFQVSPSLFDQLGIHPALGRFFTSADTDTNHVILSYETWQRYFSGDPNVVGRTVMLDDGAHVVVGVATPGVQIPTDVGLQSSALWFPFAHTDKDFASFAIARLRPGISAAAAQRELTDILWQGPYLQPPSFHRGDPMAQAVVSPILDTILQRVRPLLLLMYLAATVVLLVGCVNLANINLVRGAARAREFALRTALGASRKHIGWQLLTETALIALAGGIIGIALGAAVLPVFSAFGSELPRWSNVHVDAAVLLYTAALITLTTIVTNLFPMFALNRSSTAIKSAGRSADPALNKRLRSILVIMETALAVALVVSAGLLVRSFVTLTHAPLGFDSENLYNVRVERPVLPVSAIPNSNLNPVKELRFFQRAIAGIEAVPGVTSVSAGMLVPFKNDVWGTSQINNGIFVSIPIKAVGSSHGVSEDAPLNIVTAGFFSTLKVPLLRGRLFTASDVTHSQHLVILSASLARRIFGTSENATGREIRDVVGGSVYKVVGIVGDVRYSFEDPIYNPRMYILMLNGSAIAADRNFLVRTSGQVSGLTTAISSAFAHADPLSSQPEVQSYADLIFQSALQARAMMQIFLALGLITLLLAVSGIYAVTSYTVERRTHEFGIRKALGAQTYDVLRFVVGNVLVQAAIGLALGLVLAGMFSQFLTGFLFETSALDPMVFALVMIFILAASVLAALVPATRAMSIDPAVALRYE